MERPFEPMSAHDFRSVIIARGWTLGDVATRWGISAARMSQVLNRPAQRARHWEDALFGLPHRSVTERSRQRRQAMAEAAGADQRPRRGYGTRKESWLAQAHVAQGSVFVVEEEQGPHLAYGCRGVVIARRSGAKPALCLLFESGYLEWLELAWLSTPACWLQYNGATLTGFTSYVYTTEANALAALKQGSLRFPA